LERVGEFHGVLNAMVGTGVGVGVGCGLSGELGAGQVGGRWSTCGLLCRCRLLSMARAWLRRFLLAIERRLLGMFLPAQVFCAARARAWRERVASQMTRKYKPYPSTSVREGLPL